MRHTLGEFYFPYGIKSGRGELRKDGKLVGIVTRFGDLKWQYVIEGGDTVGGVADDEMKALALLKRALKERG